jgi:hypothetical protein
MVGIVDHHVRDHRLAGAVVGPADDDRLDHTRRV